ncbi:unnamed protein product [Oppiella nova]|uniref:Uncharacterized protein n=1 Tax=Oppiella nova TaxID=334625 RepID=A0A7R9MNB1_9ACAR|nr:unnamed protein product [Oppiella nova]CAG2180163.1 unnamed protein product [Oppiella nova]
MIPIRRLLSPLTQSRPQVMTVLLMVCISF